MTRLSYVIFDNLIACVYVLFYLFRAKSVQQTTDEQQRCINLSAVQIKEVNETMWCVENKKEHRSLQRQMNHF